jgi:hypothetical protein
LNKVRHKQQKDTTEDEKRFHCIAETVVALPNHIDRDRLRPTMGGLPLNLAAYQNLSSESPCLRPKALDRMGLAQHMKSLLTRLLFGYSMMVLALPLLAASRPVENVSSGQARALFRHPPREYSSGPLWVWNDLLTEEQIRTTLHDLAHQNIRQVWVHPRPGLMTPYLGAEWFKLWQIALEEAKALDMNVWIYDENSYPSGFAGGFVPEAMPESRGRGLTFQQITNAPKFSADILGVYELRDQSFIQVTDRVRAGEALPEAKYVVAKELRTENRPWNANRPYVNLLSPGVTEKFLEVTMEPYRREIGQHFGKRVPGVFTDEPNIRPNHGLAWSETLVSDFQKRWGYNLLEHLPSLHQPVGDWRKVRHNYYQLLNELFIERWARPNHDYCEQNGLAWTGHYWDHDWPDCTGVPDNMAMYAWHQWPAIDCLMNQYSEHTHAQFGNVRMVKELSSVANQMGRRRTLCEIYGAGGWDLRFEDMKRIADWLAVLGVNTMNQHLSYVTIRGARKRDHPQSFSYHTPWWEAYHVSADYLARVSAAVAQGEQLNSIVILEPTTTAWMYQGDSARLKELGESFFQLLMKLEAAQVEYDLVSEDVLQRHGQPGRALKTADGREIATSLRIGQREYDTLVIPPFTENLNRTTKELLERVTATRFAPGGVAPRLDGALTSPAEGFYTQADLLRTNGMKWADELVEKLRLSQQQQGFAIERAPGDKGILFHQRRHLKDGQILFLVNTSRESPSRGSFRTTLKGIECWDPYTGETKPYPLQASATGVTAQFELPPSGSLLLLLSPRPTRAQPPAPQITTLQPSGPVSTRRLAPNVLTLDYVDVTIGKECRTNSYFYPANKWIWQYHGLSEGNPWDSAVQWKDELLRLKFKTGTGFTATYRFVIEGAVPTNLVIERADLYEVSCNGKPVQGKAADWWLDAAFGRIPLGAAARGGENTVTIKASPLTIWHELEPAYLLGDFKLKSAEPGFVVVAETPSDAGPKFLRCDPGPQEKRSGGWNAQGYPFYSGGVEYTEEFQLDQRSGRYFVHLPDWHGSVAKIVVNGRPAGYVDAPPWDLDVTRFLHKGSNKVQTIVIGTLKNTLGPHHGKPGLGSAWPHIFQKSPETGPAKGADYHTVAYGLYQPFVLKHETKAKR